MSRTSSSRAARVLGVALLLTLASRTDELRAAELYRWVTEDGRVEIGTAPPPGVSATPWSPAQERAAQPAPLPQPTPRAPRADAEPDAQRESQIRAHRRQQCARQRESARAIAQQVGDAEREIARLEQRIETLDASEVAYSRTSCTSDGIYGPKSDCVASRFDRDAEIELAQQALERAKEKLDDLELRERRAADSEACAATSR